MSDLISRQAAYEVLTEYYHHRTEIQHQALKEALDRVPAVQPERKTGKWNVYYHDYNDFSYSCNWCGYSAPYNLAGGVYKQKKWAFCPNCGARMGADK